MKFSCSIKGRQLALRSLAFALIAFAYTSHCATMYVDGNCSTPAAPYSTWATAATNIQDAVDAAGSGDQIFVTNGIYSSGGKVMETNLTNRVAIYKPITIQSVNGPVRTIIQGAAGVTNTGPNAVRCVWITNGAVLSGFTLLYGGTRTASNNVTSEHMGGGIWGTSTNAIITNCVIQGNTASVNGGGAYQVSLLYCTISGNQTTSTTFIGEGGGADLCNVTGCLIKGNVTRWTGGGLAACKVRNSAIWRNVVSQGTGGGGGGGAWGCTLINCTVTENVGVSSLGGGAGSCSLTNCIVFGNTTRGSNPDPSTNYNSTCRFGFSCTAPLPSGAGNISADPRMMGDGVHIAGTSPCRGTGSVTVLSGMDFDGQAWLNPPSIGCDEWFPIPSMPYQPQISFPTAPDTLNLGVSVVLGQPPFTFSWQKDGNVLSNGSHYSQSDTTNLVISGFGTADGGNYVCIASNSFGMATSPPVSIAIHCVALSNASPVSPFLDWSTAATNIQDAIDAAAADDFVLVTNGVYAVGGKVIAGDLTNRIAIYKPLFVSSVTGSAFTTIQGAGVSNGPAAVRCAWLTDGAVLNGFTLQGGGTRTNGDISGGPLQSGGGIWATSTNASIVNCVIQSNTASHYGGGSYQGSFQRCSFLRNRSDQWGGAVYAAIIRNSLLSGNFAFLDGGASYYSTLINCTVSANSVGSLAAAVSGDSAINTTIYNNTASSSSYPWANWDMSAAPNASYCCTTPALSGIGNITNSPQLLDGIHLAIGSPCVGAGTAAAASGSDLDGELWASPPSIGCDEFYQTNIVGPLSVSIQPRYTMVMQGGFFSVTAQIVGKFYGFFWSWGDGVFLTNSGVSGSSHFYNSPGTCNLSLTAFNQDYPGGASTNVQIQVLPQLPAVVSALNVSSTNIGLSFAGQPGGIYYLERATDLTPPVAWTPLTNLSPITTNSFSIQDTNANSALRFYRARRLFP